MRYELRLTAYDVMDQVFIVLAVEARESTETHKSDRPLTRTTTVQGTGEDDVLEWARDALVAAVETL